MAFLDEIDKKLTMLGQGAIQKTKEVSDTAKLTAAIKNLENQKKECLAELGTYFVLNYRELANEQENILISKIDSFSTEIAQYQEQLSKLKRIIYCPQCNAEIPMNSLFCNVCGVKIENRLTESITPDKGICKKCGTSIEEGQLFCTNCGTKVAADDIPALEEGTEGRVVKEETKLICPDCGNETTDEQMFCIYCGKTLK